MSATKVRRIGRAEAEQLLNGAPPAADRDALAALLDLAAAPPRPAELSGRRAAVAAMANAFREAGSAPAPRRHRRSLVVRIGMVKLVTGAAVLLFGTAALAAGTGNLPDSVQHGAHDLLSALGVQVPDGNPSGPDAGQPTGRPTPSVAPTSRGVVPTGPATPAMKGMCRSWQAAQDDHGKHLDPAVEKALATAANGRENIAAFCAAVLAAPEPSTPAPPSSEAPHPGNTTHPSRPPHKR
jgi:hypothetical protein